MSSSKSIVLFPLPLPLAFTPLLLFQLNLQFLYIIFSFLLLQLQLPHTLLWFIVNRLDFQLHGPKTFTVRLTLIESDDGLSIAI